MRIWDVLDEKERTINGHNKRIGGGEQDNGISGRSMDHTTKE